MEMIYRCEITGIHPYTFRVGEPGTIIGLSNVKPDGLDWRECLKVVYADGVIDYIPLSDAVTENYKITVNKDKIGTHNEKNTSNWII